MNSILLTCENEAQRQVLVNWWKEKGRMSLNCVMADKLAKHEIEYEEWPAVEVLALEGKRPPVSAYAVYDAVDTPKGSGIVLDMWYERRQHAGISISSCWTYSVILAGSDTIIECDEKAVIPHMRGE